MTKKQALLTILVGTLAAVCAHGASAQNGFYGGVSMRDDGTDALGLAIGKLPSVWNKFAAPVVAEDSTQRALVFGGYRWANDVSVEAAFNASDKYALRPGVIGVSSVGLGLSDPTRTWNADVYTAWEFVHSLSVYGRLGYAQSDVRPLIAPLTLPGDMRRLRDGVNYGVGLRYDLTQALGLRVEYSRFNRYSGDSATVGIIPESDSVTLGVQFKF
jgi:opacity protein-like surface antigen